MVYAMSDIHGEYWRFRKMLRKIKFSANDTLYIIGDVIDRGNGSIKILKYIMKKNNIIMLMGNHEDMCINTFEGDDEFEKKLYEFSWRKQNGGEKTYASLMKLSVPERSRILDFIRSLPMSLDIEVNGRKFYLVHGFPDAEDSSKIWKRVTSESVSPYEGVTVIVGHTPVFFITGRDDDAWKIWHNENNDMIDIDCGCGHFNCKNRRLACLCLDNMEEYYV